MNKKVTLPDANYHEIEENINDKFSLEIATEKCPFYMAKMVKNVKIGESPEYIKKHLIAAGMRPINNVVDISNYVMLEYGQPMHFFDYDKLGKKILVRDAKDGEKIITLDGKERILTEKDIVITDGNKPVCIAGVMGGENTEVDENTTSILIESAIFDSVSIRNTAQRLDLKSEASIRYGKGLNFEYTIAAINRACALLEKYASGEVLSGEVVHDKVDKTLKTVDFTANDINKLLGIVLTDEDIKTEISRLDFEYEYHDKVFHVIIPRRRLDLDPNIADIAEEIGRLYGYENLVSTLPKVPIRRGTYAPDVKIRKDISKRLRSLGLNECKTYTLTSPEMANTFKYDETKNVVLPNPMSIDKSIVRTSIIPSLINTYDYNKARKVSDIMLYEISKTYNNDYEETQKVAMLIKGNYIVNSWNHTIVKADFYVLKGIVENLLNYLGFKNRYSFEATNEIKDLHPGMQARVLLDRKPIGIIGRIHPSLKKDEIYVCELSINPLMSSVKPLKYKEASKYPEISKDIAFVLNKNIMALELINEIKRLSGRLLTNIDVFDVYTGENVKENEKSIAFNLIFSDPNRTLNEEEVMEIFNKISVEIPNKFNAKLRDK